MSDQMTELKLETARVIDAPRERLYDAWLDPAMLAKFMTPGPGMSVPKVEADTREGGRFTIVMRAGDQDMPHSGTYKTLNRPNRIAFTWESPFSKIEDSVVTVDFEETVGGTNVKLSHVRFETEESRDNHLGGWSAILETLEGVL